MSESVLETVLVPLRAAVLAWLRGDITATANHLGPPMPETHELTLDLQQANDKGLLTLGSQPARFNQRAYLDGITTPARAHHLTRHLRAAGLWCHDWSLTDPPTALGCVLVTDADDPTISTFAIGTIDPDPRQFGPPPDDAEISTHIQHDTLAMSDDPALRYGHIVSVVDPDWGRPRHLWASLRAALDHPDWITRSADARHT